VKVWMSLCTLTLTSCVSIGTNYSEARRASFRLACPGPKSCACSASRTRL